MSDPARIKAELELIRSRFPDLEYREADNWARIPAYPLPEGWDRDETEIAFMIPADLPSQAPYGFWVRPLLALPNGGVPSNTSGPVSTGFGDNWQQFSWTPEAWQPDPDDLRRGTNMLDFVRSFADRLAEMN